MNPMLENEDWVYAYLVEIKKLKCKPFTCSNLVRISNKALEQMNSFIYEPFAENAYDEKEALSTDDRMVLSK